MSENKNKSTKPKGGKRPGAGRKPSTLKGVLKKLPGDTSALILAEINANQRWIQLADSDDEAIQFQVLRYLTDRAYGKPKQQLEHTGKDGSPLMGDPDARILELFVKAEGRA